MYCSNCGTQISESGGFCPGCGSELPQADPIRQPPARPRGFSPRIIDPAFGRYIKSSNRWSAIVSFILAVCAVIGFYIAGEMGLDKMENPAGLFIGLSIGAMFLLIALFQILGRKRSGTWDGTVEDKSVKKKTRHNENYSEDYLEYRVIVRGDDGKKHTIKGRSVDIYNYFAIGDRVRHHAGLKSLEKYDKTGDKFIPCNACGTLCDIRAENCFRCKCPLLK